MRRALAHVSIGQTMHLSDPDCLVPGHGTTRSSCSPLSQISSSLSIFRQASFSKRRRASSHYASQAKRRAAASSRSFPQQSREETNLSHLIPISPPSLSLIAIAPIRVTPARTAIPLLPPSRCGGDDVSQSSFVDFSTGDE